MTAEFGVVDSEEEAIRKLFLAEPVEGEYATVDEVAEVTLFFATMETSCIQGRIDFNPAE
ncbi:MAG: hypothetical protein AB9903_14665 [Vulcanimicrobiota bacterium]